MHEWEIDWGRKNSLWAAGMLLSLPDGVILGEGVLAKARRGARDENLLLWPYHKLRNKRLDARESRRGDVLLAAPVSVEEFWEEAHAGSYRVWLTGSRPQDVFRNLGIEELVTHDRPLHVLNVGVGEGHDT